MYYIVTTYREEVIFADNALAYAFAKNCGGKLRIV